MGEGRGMECTLMRSAGNSCAAGNGSRGLNSFLLGSEREKVYEAILAWLRGYAYEYGHPARVGVFPAAYIADEVAGNRDKEHYVTIACFENEFQTRWVDEEAKMFRIAFDLDASDIDVARKHAARLVRVLGRELGLNTVDIHFTGSKGYRIYVYLDKLYPAHEVLGVWVRFSEYLKAIAPSVDMQQCKNRAMVRLPFTVNRKSGRECVPVDRRFEPIPAGKYPDHLSSVDVVGLDDIIAFIGYEPEDEPVQVRIVRFGTPQRASHDRWKWVERVAERGLPDGRKRFLGLTYARYLRQYLGVDEDTCVEMCSEFVRRCCENWGNCEPIRESEIRGYCRRAVKPYAACDNRPCRPWGLDAYRNNPQGRDLYDILVKVLEG